MSLDVYLYGPEATTSCFCGRCNHEHTRVEKPELYWANITHNLTGMADAAGIYQALWRPEGLGITTARQLIEPLRKGLHLLEADPRRFKQFNARNGWGEYDHFVPFVARYLDACEQFPDATVHASR